MSRKHRIDLPTGAGSQAPESASSDSPALPPQQAAESAVSDEGIPPQIASNSESARPARRLRIDAPQSFDELADTESHRTRSQSPPKRRYIDDAHSAGPAGPHFRVTARRSNLTALTGQFLAYIGVLGLTVGTAIVIYGHFGGYTQYTPTGWLVTTVAQMLLFLGVINLVSGGIEQNNEDVSRRINTLGEQLQRIELVTERALRGPKIPAERYADPDSDAVPETTRESVPAARRR